MNILDMITNSGNGAAVRRVADVPAAGSGGIHMEFISLSRSVHDMAEKALGQWRPADIAEADEENRMLCH